PCGGERICAVWRLPKCSRKSKRGEDHRPDYPSLAGPNVAAAPRPDLLSPPQGGRRKSGTWQPRCDTPLRGRQVRAGVRGTALPHARTDTLPLVGRVGEGVRHGQTFAGYRLLRPADAGEVGGLGG